MPFTQDWGLGVIVSDDSALFLRLCRGFCASTYTNIAQFSKSSSASFSGEKAGGPPKSPLTPVNGSHQVSCP